MTTVQSTEWGPLSEPIHNDVAGERPWRDNAFLCFWNPDGDVVGTLHTSTSPNAEGRRARFSIQAGGKTVEVAEELEPGTFTRLDHVLRRPRIHDRNGPDLRRDHDRAAVRARRLHR
jgi:hypothetical protein